MSAEGEGEAGGREHRVRQLAREEDGGEGAALHVRVGARVGVGVGVVLVSGLALGV